jgi:hypothetical protein
MSLSDFTTERNRQAVDFRLCAEGDLLVVPEPQKTANTADEIENILLRERVVEGQHRHGVTNPGELCRRRGADPAARRVGAEESGIARLDRRVASPQGIIFGVRNGGRVVLVVALVVPGNLGSEPLELGLGLPFVERLGRDMGEVFGWHGSCHWCAVSTLHTPFGVIPGRELLPTSPE